MLIPYRTYTTGNDFLWRPTSPPLPDSRLSSWKSWEKGYHELQERGSQTARIGIKPWNQTHCSRRKNIGGWEFVRYFVNVATLKNRSIVISSRVLITELNNETETGTKLSSETETRTRLNYETYGLRDIILHVYN